MFKSNKFGRIFWVDDELEFKSCPLCVDGTGDFDCEDYVSEWTDWEGVDMNELLAIHKTCILNKTQFAGNQHLKVSSHPRNLRFGRYNLRTNRSFWQILSHRI